MADPIGEVAELLAFLTPRERAELEALTAAERPEPDLIDRSFPAQAAFIEDAARLQVLLCTRRAGKSFGIALKMVLDAWRHPRANYLYVALTLDSGRKAIWKEGFKLIDERFKLGLDFNESRSEVTLPNGSTIYLLGMDAGERQKEKARGGKYRGAAVDEAQSFSTELGDLLAVIRPALADLRGWLVLAGTPGILPRGLFYDLTHDQDPQTPKRWARDELTTAGSWSGHCWNASVNPHMKAQWEEDLAAMLAVNPRVVETPTYQRERLGRWVRDLSRLVYRYEPSVNDWNGVLPTYAAGRWHHVLACDLGFDDPTALVALAYHDHDPNTYVRRAEARAELIFSSVAAWVREWAAVYDFDEYVIDGANKQAVETMIQQHGIPWQTADKTGKADFIRLMDDDFILAKVRVDSVACATLVSEWAGLVWDEKALARGRQEEHPAAPNHAADACLYGWRRLYGYLSSRLETPPPAGSSEWAIAEAARMKAEATERAREAQEWE